MEAKRHGPGRPRKFGARPARPVTVTLPDDIIERLAATDDDLGSAIVALAERVPAAKQAPAELASYGDRAVIIVTPVDALSRLPGVELVPTAPRRALIALERGVSIAAFELTIRDALESGDGTHAEREVLKSVAGLLRRSRQSRKVAAEERTIIVLKPKGPRRSPGTGRS